MSSSTYTSPCCSSFRCPDGKIRLFCKGADAMIMARIRHNNPIAQDVRNHLVGLPLSPLSEGGVG